MGRDHTHSTPDQTVANQVVSNQGTEKHLPHQRFNPRDPEMEMLLRGLLHELRNPLSSILTAATLLQDSPLPDTTDVNPSTIEEAHMLLDVVKKESLQLNHILTEFASYIKLPPPKPGNFDLAQTARAALRELQAAGVLLPPIKVTDELPEQCNVWGDQSQIHLAFAHILRNAAEALPEGGEVRLWAILKDAAADEDSENKNNANVIICVSDSGKGFTLESRDRAFQPFYSSKEHCVGLGLSSVRSLIEAAEGHVWLEENSPFSPLDSPPPSTPRAPQTTSPLSICFELPRSKS